LNAEFPSTHFSNRAILIPGSQKPRVSTGLELQVLMPVVNAPFRLYWAYNLSYLNTTFQPPVAISRDNVINDTTLQNGLNILGAPFPYYEKHSMFRFSIGRTF
jgi:outer membrane protein insertion porin family